MAVLAHFGTFDVENYGDLLLAAILERRLSDLGHGFVHVSPHGGPPVWDDCVPTVAADAIIADPPALAGVVVGGGHIIHASPTSLDRYDQGGLSPTVAYPSLWLGAAYLAAHQNVPYSWNAPGVPQPFSPAGSRLVDWATSVADYLAVRDRASHARLVDAGVSRLIRVVPDTALETSRLWSAEQLEAAFVDLFVTRGREVPERVVVIHLNRRYANGDAGVLAARLDRIAKRLDAIPILIAMGPCHGDDELQREIGQVMTSDPLVIDRPQSLRQIAACIARAEAYLGSSLHGLITACSFGTRSMVIVPRSAGTIGKFAGFLEQFQLQRWLAESWQDTEPRIDALLAAPADSWTRVLDAATPILDEHWNRLKASLAPPAKSRRRASGQIDKQGAIDRLALVNGSASLETTLYAPIIAEQAMRAREHLNTANEQRRQKEKVVAEQNRLSEEVDVLRGAADESRQSLDQLRNERDQHRSALDRERQRLEAKIAVGRKKAEEEQQQKEDALTERDLLIAELARERERLEEEIAAGRKNAALERKGKEEATAELDLLRGELARERERLEKEIAVERTELAEERRRRREATTERDRVQAELTYERAEARQQDEQRANEEKEQLAQFQVAVEVALRREENLAKDQLDAAARLSQLDGLLSKLANRPSSKKQSHLQKEVQQQLSAIREDLTQGARRMFAGETGEGDIETETRNPDSIAAGQPVTGGPEELASKLRRNLVTVIVPVFNAFEELSLCLESLVRHGQHPHQILIIDDASTDDRVWPLILTYAESHQHIFAVRNERNLGYTATVNRGCQLCSGDLILLNSDTQVTHAWLEKMAACAASQVDVATVTALSNAAGAFSVPENHKDNDLPRHYSVDEVATLVDALSERIRPQVPTGNGFCMFVTRRALDGIGLFDDQNFPSGYGEENDFCMRALSNGFLNLIDDSTYVFHKRSASFDDRKVQLLEQGRRRLRQIHPKFKRLITEWERNDSVDDLRSALARAISSAGNQPVAAEKQSILYVLHEAAGGTPLTSADLIRHVSSDYRCLVLRTAVDHWTLCEYIREAIVPIRRYYFQEAWKVDQPLADERIRVILAICTEYSVSLSHIRHLLGSGPEIIDTLKSVGVPIVFSFHDFYTLCPTVQLIDDRGVYCGGECTAGDGRCVVSPKWFREGMPVLKHQFVHEHRARMAKSLALCDRYVTTSKAARDVIIRAFPFLDSPSFQIIEHGRDFLRREAASMPKANQLVGVACFGALGTSKGSELLQKIMKLDMERGPRFQFHILGYMPRSFNPKRHGGIYHGPYDRESLVDKLAKIGPSFAMIPSIWPETYCHTLTEAWAAGLPVFASAIGTLQERIEKHGGGWLLNYRDPEAWYEGMLRVLESPDSYRAEVDSIARMTFKSSYDMAEEYIHIYQELHSSSADREETSSVVMTSKLSIRDRHWAQESLGTEPVVRRSFELHNFLDLMQSEENFTMSRWCDGEWRSILGRSNGRTRGGQSYSAEVGEELRQLLRRRPPYSLELFPREDIFGSCVHDWIVAEKLEALDWITPNTFHRASMSGNLDKIIEAFHMRPAWVLVGPQHLKAAADLLKFDEHVRVPADCFSSRAEILERVLLTAAELPRNSIITFSVGWTANLLIDEVFHRLGDRLSLIDAGSVWDPYAGVASRSYMEDARFKTKLKAAHDGTGWNRRRTTTAQGNIHSLVSEESEV